MSGNENEQPQIESLGNQIGTDPIDMSQGRVDMRRLSIIDGSKVGAVLYSAVRARTSPTWATVLEWYLNINVSVGGRGRRDLLRAESASRGGSLNVDTEIVKPDSFIERNITNRNWKEKELARLNEEK